MDEKDCLKQRGVYLVVAQDNDPKSRLAFVYAANRARATGGKVGVAIAMDFSSFQHWGGVEYIINSELRENSEKEIWGYAKEIQEISKHFVGFYLQEGVQNEAIASIIQDNKEIIQLILTPGSLASYFSSKGLSSINIPVVVIPDHLDEEDIYLIS